MSMSKLHLFVLFVALILVPRLAAADVTVTYYATRDGGTLIEDGGRTSGTTPSP
jgi:hypothetical protein